MYWVDPNLGMVDDAVKVYCNMSSGETCVYPDVHASKMPNIPWRKSGTGWYSTLRGGFKITYDSVGDVQMRFLRLLSENARQNFTYTCINSVAWYDDAARSYNQALTFKGDNDERMGAAKHKPRVLLDGCKVRRSEEKSVFEMKTKRTAMLPIVDFKPVDYGLPHQAFGFEVGPVCFK